MRYPSLAHWEVTTNTRTEPEGNASSKHATVRVSAGDTIAANCEVIEAQVKELRQLFNEIDPAPFHERELDPKAEEFIVGWAEEVPRERKLALEVIVGRGPGRSDEAELLRQAIHMHFERGAASARRRLRTLFHQGRLSLAIGLAFLAGSIVVGDVL